MWKRWGTEYVALKTLDEGFSHLMHEFKTSDEVMQERPLPIPYIHPSAVFTSRRLPTVPTFPTISTDGNYQTRQFDLALPDEGDKD
ncbi:16238_t:CDS:2 [Gigaspora margarita]|uniref:16238_t:CDS:1 n=1 Tax=Gigaspora margarita TaxID=4874 RepID=A0ABN7UEU5_GIGMA|nr:16238_t:CDS:2 [Gigaspora margarita]